VADEPDGDADVVEAVASLARQVATQGQFIALLLDRVDALSAVIAGQNPRRTQGLPRGR
jgi:hypothetical protein